MTETRDTERGFTLDAIEAVARQGEKRFLLISLGIFVAVVAVLGYFLVKHLNRLPELADVPVAIMLPRLDAGSAQANAARQWEGFFLAYIKNDVIDAKDQHRYHFNYLPNNESTGEVDACDAGELKTLAKESEVKAAWQRFKCWRSRDEVSGCDADSIGKLAEKNDAEAMLRQVRCWYHKDDIRVFIITMSGAVKVFRQKFIDWANTLDADDRPVLLATVVSAPEVADFGQGVFRHYIRSRDESDTLATYIESLAPHPSRIGIIHVSDEYGTSAKDLLKARLERNASVGAYIVPFNKPEPGVSVRDDFNKFIADGNDLAVVIGYGSMIEMTLDRLKALDTFHGPILLVSTFTEEGWRPEQKPEDECFWDRIRYVGPITDDEETDRERRGVVFQFSYLTLDRALKCKEERGVEDFWACFTKEQSLSSSGRKWNPHIEFTRHGDSHVSLGIFKLNDGQPTAVTCPAGEGPE